MTEEGHVYVEGGEEGNSYNIAGDHVIAGSLAMCMMVGLTGNIPAAIYFWKRSNRTVYDTLYLAISSIDICTCAITFPVISSLLNNRMPMLFANYSFCATWASAFYISGRYSAFMAFVISVTRTVAIYAPHYNIGKLPIKSICAIYVALMACFYVALFALKSTWIIYSSVVVYCNPVFMYVHDWLWYPYIVVKLLILLLLPLSVFISFILSIVPLIKRRKIRCGHSSSKFWKASVTITLFTAIYLVCQLPMFVITAMGCARFWFNLELPDSEFLYWYDYLLAEFFFTALDSALNPCLYFWRMADFRRWVFDQVRTYEQFVLQRCLGKRTIEVTKV